MTGVIYYDIINYSYELRNLNLISVFVIFVAKIRNS